MTMTDLLKNVLLLSMILILGACSRQAQGEADMEISRLDLSAYSSSAPGEKTHLLFIHHSCGGQLMADVGLDVGKQCIYETHPNGGGLRSLLEQNNYIVHEASYGSLVGDKTDVCHWHAKFRDHMERILVTGHQDEVLTDGARNQVVMFKSCYPNNWIVAEGTSPGDPDDCVRTTENMKAAYKALLPLFAAEPDTLFVAVTAPPLAEPVLYKRDRLSNLIKRLLNRSDTVEKIGQRARVFNAWLADMENGWLADYDEPNVVLLDLYQVLTGDGVSVWSRYPTGAGRNSHPSRAGNGRFAANVTGYLNRAVDRMEGNR